MVLIDQTTQSYTSSPEHLNVLLIEDNPLDARLILELLTEQRVASFNLVRVDSLASGLSMTNGVDVVLLDLNLRDSEGLETFRKLHTTAPWLPIVVLSGLVDEAVAVRAVHGGAQDYLVKSGIDGTSLARALRYAVERQRAEGAIRLSESRLRLLAQAGIVLGASLDEQTILRGLADLAVQAFADCCLVDVVYESGVATRVAATFGDVVPQELRPHIGDEQVETVLQRLKLQSSIVAPVRSHTQGLGAISFLRGDRRVPFVSDDLLLAEELGRRAGLAVAHARQYQVAQTSIRERDRLLGVVAHDLRNPLAGIAGYVDLTLLRAAGSDRLDPRSLEWLNRAKAIVNSMARDLDDLLDAANLQSGRTLALRAEVVDLVALARRLTGDFQALSPHHVLHVETSLEALPGDWDVGRMQRVLANLLTNAIKYSPEGSAVTVSVTHEADSDRRPWAVLTVRDEGIGIPAGEISRVSTRFFRASNVLRRFPGSGIGLAGVREVVEQHGGSLHIESQENHSTTVTVRLPVAASTNGQPLRARSGEPIGHDRRAQPRVLIVEDDPATRDLLAHVLHQNDYVVLEASNGEAGLRVAERELPSLVLLDLLLPELTGMEMLHALRQQPLTCNIPVVVVSGLEMELEGLGDLADAHLAKPVDMAMLLRTLERLLAFSKGE